jgi:hypothetical protein
MSYYCPKCGDSKKCFYRPLTPEEIECRCFICNEVWSYKKSIEEIESDQKILSKYSSIEARQVPECC